MARVLVNHLRVRTGPSVNSPEVAYYDAGQIIHSNLGLVKNEGRIWLKYMGGSGNERFICQRDINGDIFIDIGEELPKQKNFADNRIKRYGCCFLCTCIKGGLTTYSQCEDCFNWGINSGKLRSSDCYVQCDKEAWAREISQRYGTPFHADYIFQKSSRPHFWLTQGGREIFNSIEIGYH